MVLVMDVGHIGWCSIMRIRQQSQSLFDAVYFSITIQCAIHWYIGFVVIEQGVIEIAVHSALSGKLFESPFLSPFFEDIINIDGGIVVHRDSIFEPVHSIATER